MATRLEKRLIAASSLGITIEFEGSHRWITSSPTELFDFEDLSTKSKGYSSKVYGGVNQALNKVDAVLADSGQRDLESHFDWLNELYFLNEEEGPDFIITCGEEENA